MKIIVTGGTGFLGRHVVWRLAAAGHHVVFTGRNGQEAEQVIAATIAATKDASSVQFVRLEHGCSDAGRKLLANAQDAQAIVHCAALASPWGSRTAFTRANVDSTREVLAACSAHGIGRLVHISSPSIYFEYRDRLGICEDEPLPVAVNAYAHTKKIAEQLVLAAGLPNSVILRPRAIFGPWDNALLPRLLRLLRYGRVPLLRGGQALLDMTYVDNVVDAVELALKLPAAHIAPAFNITNGEPIEAAALFGRIANSFGLIINPVHRPYVVADMVARGLELAAHLAPNWEPPFTRYSLGAIAFSQTLDLQRATTILGYRPRVTLDKGIAQTAQWWKEKSQSQ